MQKYVCQLLINALLKAKQENVLLATMATTFRMVFAFIHYQTMLSPRTSDAPLGTGVTKSASPARQAGISIQTKFAHPLQINASLLIRTVYA